MKNSSIRDYINVLTIILKNRWKYFKLKFFYWIIALRKINFPFMFRKETEQKVEACRIQTVDQADILITKRKFVKTFGRPLDLSNPKTFNEKLQVYKLFYQEKKIPELVDKYSVRNYVSNIIGTEYLLPLVGVFSNPDDIDFGSLPDRFIIKVTHGSGWNILCMDKSDFNWKNSKLLLKEWLKTNYYYNCQEWPYKSIEPRIIIEKLILGKNDSIPNDYKFFCFNGEPLYIDVHSNRFSEHKEGFFDINWNRIPLQLDPSHQISDLEKPAKFAEMLKIVRALSKGFPFVRVDLFSVPEVYFGEFTFYPMAGFDIDIPHELDIEIGKKFDLRKQIAYFKEQRSTE